MTLVEKLKQFAREGSAPINDACAQAIDEIERLRAALREIADEEDIFNYGYKLPEIAKRALGQQARD